jgi:hypothetical protein
MLTFSRYRYPILACLLAESGDSAGFSGRGGRGVDFITQVGSE